MPAEGAPRTPSSLTCPASLSLPLPGTLRAQCRLRATPRRHLGRSDPPPLPGVVPVLTSHRPWPWQPLGHRELGEGPPPRHSVGRKTPLPLPTGRPGGWRPAHRCPPLQAASRFHPALEGRAHRTHHLSNISVEKGFSRLLTQTSWPRLLRNSHFVRVIKLYPECHKASPASCMLRGGRQGLYRERSTAIKSPRQISLRY